MRKSRIPAMAEAVDRDPARLMPGVDVTSGGTEVLIRSIEAAARGICRALVIWYYGGLVQKGSWGRLKETVFQEPAALPWK